MVRLLYLTIHMKFIVSGQPILQIMLHKALQAHSQHNGLPEPMLSDPASEVEDEVSIYLGQPRVVGPERPPAIVTPTPPLLQTVPTPHRGHHEIYSQPSSLQDHSLLSHEPLTSKPATLPDNDLDHFRATFADLSGGWDGLFHEVPQPSYGFASTATSHMQPSGEGTMLDDRWASFMHNYNILTDPLQSHHAVRVH